MNQDPAATASPSFWIRKRASAAVSFGRPFPEELSICRVTGETLSRERSRRQEVRTEAVHARTSRVVCVCTLPCRLYDWT